MFSWQLGGRLVLVRAAAARRPSRRLGSVGSSSFCRTPCGAAAAENVTLSKRSQPASKGKGSRGGHAHSALIATATNHLVPTSSPFPDDCVSPWIPTPGQR